MIKFTSPNKIQVARSTCSHLIFFYLIFYMYIYLSGKVLVLRPKALREKMLHVCLVSMPTISCCMIDTAPLWFIICLSILTLGRQSKTESGCIT